MDKKTLQIVPYKYLLDSVIERSKDKDNQKKWFPKLIQNFRSMEIVNWRTYKNLRGFCCICGNRENVE